ncbi:FtsQ-type POTRA domain-containing protein [Agromyces tropicus]|uniref:FtsQ-type POTRA domain-containing protein n=1 Tax=Agromyces tropicus TaxID=555371 RepID=UPI0031DBA22C
MTEPIALPTTATADRSTTRRSATGTRDRDGGAGASTPTTRDAPSGDGASDPRGTATVTEAEGSTASDRATRRRQGAAERARRRYERREVRRFTKRSRLRRATWIAVLASVVGLAVAAVAVAYSPLMALREVRVEGASRIAAADVRAAFDDRMGTPLPLIAPDEVQEALSAFPLIETYSIETVPPGTLVVRLVERTPVGVLDASGGLVSVDAAGVVVDRLDERPDGLPLIEVEGGIDAPAFRAVGRVLRSLPQELRQGIASVAAASADDVRFELETGASVVWGNADESSLKAAVLQDLMAAAPPDVVDRYDVSAPLNPVTE